MIHLRLFFCLVLFYSGVLTVFGQVPPGYPPDTLNIFPRLKAARELGQAYPDSAAREMQALVRLSQRAPLPRWESRIRYRLGDIYVRTLQLPEATAEAFQILRLARRSTDPDPSAEMLGLVLLGDVYFSKRDYTTAARYQRQAYDLACRAGTPKEQGRTGASLGNTLTALPKPACTESAPLLHRSARLLLAAGDTITAVSTLSAESAALRQLGDLAGAEAIAREALRYYDYPILRHDIVAREGARAELGNVLHDRGYNAEALKIGQEVRGNAERLGSQMLALVGATLEADAAAALGNYREAFLAERAAHRLSDSTNSEAVTERIAALSTRYDTERREARIRALTQERRLAQLGRERATTRARALAALVGVLAVALAVFSWFYVMLRRSRARLAAAQEMEHQLNATQTRLLSVIGHDVRGPLLAVEIVSKLLEAQARHPDPAELRAIAQEVRETTTSVRGLLDNLLYWAHAQKGQLVNQPLKVMPADMIGEVGKLYAPVGAAKGVTVRTDLSADLPAVWADPNLLQTVLRNLVSNAVKFTSAGGEVLISAAVMPGGVCFQVRDTGAGLAPERLAKLLEPIADSENNTASTPGTAGERGAGLGLTVTRQFAALLGPGLTAESTLGSGTTFGLVVPAA